MDIQVDIERKDLVALNLYLFPRLRGNWITLGVLAVGIFTYIFLTQKPTTPYNFVIAAFASGIGGIAGVLVGCIVSVVMMLLMVGKKSGVLGRHHYTLTDLGLREVTDANESVHKWSGIQDIIKLPRYILLQINGYLFHVVPQRAFANEEQFLAFYEKARALHNAA